MLRTWTALLLISSFSQPYFSAESPQSAAWARTIHVEVVALDQPYLANRLGAMVPAARMYALREDVVSTETPLDAFGRDLHPENYPLEPGRVRLRAGKRPRPLVLRANQGDTLVVRFTNLISPDPPPPDPRTSPPFPSSELTVGLSVAGIAPLDRESLGTASGTNAAGHCRPGETQTLRWHAAEEGCFLFYSHAGDEGHLLDGLFGMLTVQPVGAEWYRSQVTHEDLALAMRGSTHSGHPRIDYDATYPVGHRYAGRPILRMLDTQGHLRHGDITAIITGPGAGRFPANHTSPAFAANPASPDRHQPYREFVVLYHSPFIIQAFDQFLDPALNFAYVAGQDAFGINYGITGIGAQILANRLHVGPMGSRDSVDTKFEEFFLSSWVGGDPSMVVDVPANTPEVSGSAKSDHRKATKALFPDDPSNVHHSYIGDHVKFRVASATTAVPHVHHQHAHQWLHTPNSDVSHYKDSQLLSRGTAYTMEIVYGGSGNRNQTVGDALFHCHFYPHFVRGMWALWRVHDVFERGTRLDDEGRPLWSVNGEDVDNRALPDGEIITGTPIPAVVPLPTLAMAPLPAPVRLSEDGRRAVTPPVHDGHGSPINANPGYPFFIPGIAGTRAPHPPMDFAQAEDAQGNPLRHEEGPWQGEPLLLDGGLPRHLVLGGTTVRERHSRWDFSKEFVAYASSGERADEDPDCEPAQENAIAGGMLAFRLPELGTATEKAAMQAHARRYHLSATPDGQPAYFVLNGLPPSPGAPYAEPAVDDYGRPSGTLRRYQAATVQRDVVFNKLGWHFPQQRLMTLWLDVAATMAGERPPEPLFYRANSGETVEFWHTNLVADHYELDDFQVRTPTDILGQHIHLVKFDVTASDGSANGFNYEDGSFSPDEVRDRIHAINREGGLFAWDEDRQFADLDRQILLQIQSYQALYPFFGDPPCGQNWDGAQTTIQRWHADPLLSNLGVDRTLRTVFAHDHFSPSTHQQAGLYSGLLIEPARSHWFTNGPIHGGDEDGHTVTYPARYPLGLRSDGGPTSWQAVIEAGTFGEASYREFAFAFQDMTQAYRPESTNEPQRPQTPAFTIPHCNPTACGEDGQPCRTAVWCPDSDETAALLAELPLNFGPQPVPAALSAQFDRHGLPLAQEATIERIEMVVDPEVATWDVKSPLAWDLDGQAIVFDSFRLVRRDLSCRHRDCGEPPGLAEAHLTGLEVFDLNIPGGWADPSFVLNPPIDPFRPRGGPTPVQLNFIERSSTFTVNYRNEPIDIYDTGRLVDTAGGGRRDPGEAFVSMVRDDPRLDDQPDRPDHPIDENCGDSTEAANDGEDCFRFPENPLNPTGDAVAEVRPGDPYTPLARAYAGDHVQIRTLVGAQAGTHAFALHGLKWLTEPADPNSGYRSVQSMGISEHFEMNVRLPGIDPLDPKGNAHPFQDYLYQADSGEAGIRHGIWGLIRAFDGSRVAAGEARLPRLPNNPSGNGPAFDWENQVVRVFDQPPVSWPPHYRRFVVRAQCSDIVFNDRGRTLRNSDREQGLTWQGDGTALAGSGFVYRLVEEVTARGTVDHRSWEGPLILRIAAGDFVQVVLENHYDGCLPESPSVGLSPQKLAFDVSHSAGMNIGHNRIQTVAPGEVGTYYWYGGNLEPRAGRVVSQPVEFGTVNLLAADPIRQPNAGLVGTLIVEPTGTDWVYDLQPNGEVDLSAATLFLGYGREAREFVVLFQWSPDALQGLGGPGPATEGLGAVNFRSEPQFYRLAGGVSAANRTSNAVMLPDLDDPRSGDPQVPIFRARVGSEVRIRYAAPGGMPMNFPVQTQALMVEGHAWREYPFYNESRSLGPNYRSEVHGATQVGANQSFDILTTAGAAGALSGDFKIHHFKNDVFGGWCLLRVEPQLVVLQRAEIDADGRIDLAGQIWLEQGRSPTEVHLEIDTEQGLITRRVAPRQDGRWFFSEVLTACRVGNPVRVRFGDGTRTEGVLATPVRQAWDDVTVASGPDFLKRTDKETE
ncbi:hypothetical protein SCOR_11695 [Sulfidibacter corallicola]|uniref:Multicopper oxidase n=1 Tax=Sulfidibacter corallicola TaxID=2818388 RepID=A0A8A4TGT4_SULCO|nr:hypothetical protein [Sulfidibacter corallicola]QTD48001.1 hypothetical protein J3U87_20655 [Sulfidibacter corallicola]